MIKINLLKELYKINSKSRHEQKIMEYICDYIRNNYPSNIEIEEDKAGNLYVTKGKSISYPVIVAHLDLY